MDHTVREFKQHVVSFERSQFEPRVRYTNKEQGNYEHPSLVSMVSTPTQCSGLVVTFDFEEPEGHNARENVQEQG